jgi:hypothetical protein
MIILSGAGDVQDAGPPSSARVLWLKADAEVYNDAGTTLATDGETVQQWNDQSGSSHNVSQATSGSRPTFKTGVGPNGLDAVRFDGSIPTGLEVADHADFDLSGAVSMFAVLKITTWPSLDFNTIVSKDNNASAGCVRYAGSHNLAGKRRIIERPNGNAALKSTTDMNTTDFFVIGVTQVAGVNGATKYYLNGSLESSTTMNDGVSTNKPLRIGWFSDSHTEPLYGDLVELVVYKGTVAGGDLTAIHSYFSTRTGLY